jgi:hypothetical protein
MNGTTVTSELEEYVENFVALAVSRIRTNEELQHFLTACDHKIAGTDNDRLREMLVTIEGRVCLALSRFQIMN